MPRIRKAFPSLNGGKFALWGLAFKPNTDDIREAPALELIDELTAAGAHIVSFDPEAMPNVQRQIGDKVVYASGQYEALEGADALIIATEWPEFRTPDFEKIRSLMKGRTIFDGRNVFDLEAVKKEGFTYYSIGRADVEQNRESAGA
jgi:UDPglucose 6-dehydrogenase